MRKFGAFPIIVNYNLHMQLRFSHKEDDLYLQGRREEEKQLYMKTSTTSDETLENNLYKVEIDEYESAVFRCLQKIEGNPVGRMVLGLINKKTVVWIIPETDAMKKCSCAQTNPLDYVIQPGSVARGVGFGDTVIQFQPELGDDTLFHELVHAYRYSHKKFCPICIDVPPNSKGSDCGSSEEFLAHQMENIYMSQANRPLTLDYYNDHESSVRKDVIYDFLLSHVDRLEALKYFSRHEYLAMLAAHSLNCDYNPFRDYGMLGAKFLEEHNLSTLPELPVLQP
ncbi:MAG TPA: hypothetical protein VMS18_08085 [Candidatus Binatia bacterium]|nr:hypothetical protein [Candidatus Binatia bacterium]